MLEFLWRFLAGPVVADAANHPVTWRGVEAFAGYNPVNTALYIAVGVAGLYIVSRRLEERIEVELGLAVDLLPFAFLGGFLRFVEDFYSLPLPIDVFLVTPLIYFVVGGLAAYSLLRFDLKPLRVPLVAAASALTVAFLLAFQAYLLLLVPAAALIGFAVYLRFYRSSVPEALALASQLFGGLASALSVGFFGGEAKQLLTSLIYSVIGPSGFVAAKLGLAALGIYVARDSDDFSAFLVFLALYVVGFATGLRVVLRTAAGA